MSLRVPVYLSGPSLTRWSTAWPLLLVVGLAATLLGCSKPANPNDYPVSHWLTDGEDCTRASAAAIIKSGLPYPNFGTEEVPATAGQPAKKRVTTVDMWVGPTRFVIPAVVSVAGKGYARTHPRQYQGLQGSLPHFYPVGEQAQVKDGMSSMVDVQISCSMEPSFSAKWGTGPRSNDEGMRIAKAKYEDDAVKFGSTRQRPPSVSINQRDDLGMVEVLYERGGTYTDGQPMWEASYWPLNGELKGPDGTAVPIGCATRHDAGLARYGQRGWRCSSAMYVTPNVVAEIQIYVAHVQQMPAVFEQVKELLANAKQP
jgi:hypothetical protein